MNHRLVAFFLGIALMGSSLLLQAYPIDGYWYTGIRRLLRLELIQQGQIKDSPLLPGAQKTMADIQLNLFDTSKGDSLRQLPETDEELQRSLQRLFPSLHESYSISLLDITPGRPFRYAERQAERGFQPGSVGKLAVVTALFAELQRLYPASFAQRHALLRDRQVRGGQWALYDEHTVPIFDPESLKLVKRQVIANDVFSLYEWIDHMLSVSNNGAASVVWREAILMRTFGAEYPDLTAVRADSFFTNTPKSILAEVANAVVNEPLRALDISEDEWRLGQLFTRGGTGYIPGKGGSIGTPRGLMKWMVALERGVVIDEASSLEIKRLMYMTDRRIRYAANNSLKEAAVYFKSGSLYKCNRETMPNCGKYQGNVTNFMNSVAIIEHPDGTTYLVALMSNVLKRNSNTDHNTLAGNIDQLMKNS